MGMNEALLSVRDLVIKFNLRGQVLTAIRGASLDLYEGQTLAIVGESGSGKSVFTKSFLGMLDQNGWVDSGSILFEGAELSRYKSQEEWRTVRGKKIAMVFQDPMTALNPLKTIGKQIEEVLELHHGLKGLHAAKAAAEMLGRVGISDPEARAKQYPHEFSGGMRQRVVIAIAMACKPRILICDEPTTALDVTIQAQVLDLMKKLRAELGTSMILITHDLGIVAEACDKVAIMYAGSVVEHADVTSLFTEPKHPYTQGLMSSIPSLDEEVTRLKPIKGLMPDPTNLPSGCKFHPRCPKAAPICAERVPAKTKLKDGHEVSCLIYEGLVKADGGANA